MTKIAFLTSHEGIESIELTAPWQAVKDAGLEPVLISTRHGHVRLFHHLDPAGSWPVDALVKDADAGDYAALVLPGGVANPDALRMDRDAVSFVQAFVGENRPVAAICHAAWLLIEAGVVHGKRIASWASLQTDIRNAGGTWVDEEVVVDGCLITSRKPADLPAFNRELLKAVLG